MTVERPNHNVLYRVADMSKDRTGSSLLHQMKPPLPLATAYRRHMAQILVVDDEPLIAMTMGDWVTDLGHEAVGPAIGLEEALSMCEAARLDAAILDVSLGPVTTEAVAVRLFERGVPFAVASGHDAASLSSVFARGAHLSKPYGFEAFRRMVEILLARADAPLAD
jgi:CheY-like chemotaxis protein